MDKETKGKEYFESIECAIKELKLDRRHKWFEWEGDLVRNYKFLIECTGCNGAGCKECGNKGKIYSCCPVPAFNEDRVIVKIKNQGVNNQLK